MRSGGVCRMGVAMVLTVALVACSSDDDELPPPVSPVVTLGSGGIGAIDGPAVVDPAYDPFATATTVEGG